jgi:hypothetical protein
LLFPAPLLHNPSKSAHLRRFAQMPVSGHVSRQRPASLSGARHARRVGLVDRIKSNSVCQKRKMERAQFYVPATQRSRICARKQQPFLNAG